MHRAVAIGIVFWLSVSAAQGETIHELTARADAAARRLRPDARLVQIEVATFGLAIGPSGVPDMSKVGPPTAVFFYYVSPAAGTQIRVVVRAGLSADQRRLLEARGQGAVRAEELSYTATPYTLPIPERFLELDEALARAQRGGFERECAGVNPHYGCGRVVRADLHMYVRDDGAQTPIWRFEFGQDARGGMVTRHVEAVAGRIATVETRRTRGDGAPPAATPFTDVVLRVQRSERPDAPAVTAVRHGEEVWVVVTAQVNAKMSNPRMCIVIESATGRELDRSCQETAMVIDAGAGTLSYRIPVRLSLNSGVNAAVFGIRGLAIANGVTEEARTSVRVSH
jgi:hypothetical protein